MVCKKKESLGVKKKAASCEVWTHDPWFTRPVLYHWAKEAPVGTALKIVLPVRGVITALSGWHSVRIHRSLKIFFTTCTNINFYYPCASVTTLFKRYFLNIIIFAIFTHYIVKNFRRLLKLLENFELNNWKKLNSLNEYKCSKKNKKITIWGFFSKLNLNIFHNNFVCIYWLFFDSN